MASSALSSNNSVLSAPLLSQSYADSFFLPKKYRTAPNFVRETETVDATFTSWSKASYVIPRNHHFVGRTYFEVTVAALGGITAGETAEYVDGAPYFAISRMKLIYGTKTIQSWTGAQVLKFINEQRDAQETEAVATDEALGYSLAERRLRGTAAQTWIIRLPYFWDRLPCHYLHAVSNSLDLKLELTFNTLPTVINQSLAGDTVTSAMTLAKFHFELYHVEEGESTQYDLMRQTGTGISFRVIDFQEHTNEAIATAVTEFSLELKNFSMPSHGFLITVQRQSDIDTVNTRSYLNYLTIDDIELKSGGKSIIAKTGAEIFLKRVGPSAKRRKDQSQNIYFIPFAFTPWSVSESNGLLAVQEMNNPKLYLYWDAATGQANYLTVTSLFTQFYQEVGGSLDTVYDGV